MKKIIAIFFLSVLSFNWLGYRFVFDFLAQKHNEQFDEKLAMDNYNEQDLISIKAPISLPYYNNATSFERVNGEIEINGVQYKYVKRRFFSDSIEVLCIPNVTATQIQTAKDNFFRQANDLQTNEQGKKAPSEPVFKNLLSEYCDEVAEYDFSYSTSSHLYNLHYLLFIPAYTADPPNQPPDIARVCLSVC